MRLPLTQKQQRAVRGGASLAACTASRRCSLAAGVRPAGRRAQPAGEPIGMFGPVWLEHADGTIEPASWHTLSEERRHSTSRAFHAGCFVPDYVPAWMRPLDACASGATPARGYTSQLPLEHDKPDRRGQDRGGDAVARVRRRRRARRGHDRSSLNAALMRAAPVRAPGAPRALEAARSAASRLVTTACYQVPLLQPPCRPVPGLQVRVVAPFSLMIENVSPFVDSAVTV